ncbi:MAG: glycosyltransferase family 2 protein [Elusimicrobiaceae bacterium]|nr:glycosyltransferase family 2 protein [Elusimicrobiaceae bacterium]
MKTTVLIPAYNEIKTIAAVFDRLSELKDFDFEVVFIDDASRDGTLEWARAALAENRYPFLKTVLSHQTNQGKGAALITGIRAAEGEITVIQDADLEYDPAQLPPMCRLIEEGRADVVYGSRFLSHKSETYSVIYLLGNKTLTWLTNLLCGGDFTDSYTCYKAFRTGLLKSFDMRSSGFEIEAEFSVKSAMRKCRFAEVPIVYHCRSRAEGKKINGRDAVKGILAILKFWRQELRRPAS